MLCIIGDSHLFFIYTIYIPQYHYLVDPPELALVYAQLLSSMNHFIRFLFDFLYVIGWFVSWFKGMWKNGKKGIVVIL